MYLQPRGNSTSSFTDRPAGNDVPSAKGTDGSGQIIIGAVVLGATTTICILICVLRSALRNRRKHKGRACFRLHTAWKILFARDLDNTLAELDAPETKGTGELHGVDRKQEMEGGDRWTELEAERRTGLELDVKERPSELA